MGYPSAANYNALNASPVVLPGQHRRNPHFR